MKQTALRAAIGALEVAKATMAKVEDAIGKCAAGADATAIAIAEAEVERAQGGYEEAAAESALGALGDDGVRVAREAAEAAVARLQFLREEQARGGVVRAGLERRLAASEAAVAEAAELVRRLEVEALTEQLVAADRQYLAAMGVAWQALTAVRACAHLIQERGGALPNYMAGNLGTLDAIRCMGSVGPVSGEMVAATRGGRYGPGEPLFSSPADLTEYREAALAAMHPPAEERSLVARARAAFTSAK